MGRLRLHGPSNPQQAILTTCLLALITCGVLAVGDEASALLQLREALDSKGSLSSWQPGTDFCKGWTGVSCNKEGNVQAIDLKNVDLGGSLPDDSSLWSVLSNLLYVNLHNTYLTGTLPHMLNHTNKLQAVVLSNNQLTGTLPAGWCSLQQLTSLDASGNQLSGRIPEGWRRLGQLVMMDLSHNDLQVPEHNIWGALTNLRFVALHGNAKLCNDFFVELKLVPERACSDQDQEGARKVHTRALQQIEAPTTGGLDIRALPLVKKSTPDASQLAEVLLSTTNTPPDKADAQAAAGSGASTTPAETPAEPDAAPSTKKLPFTVLAVSGFGTGVKERAQEEQQPAGNTDWVPGVQGGSIMTATPAKLPEGTPPTPKTPAAVLPPPPPAPQTPLSLVTAETAEQPNPEAGLSSNAAETVQLPDLGLGVNQNAAMLPTAQTGALPSGVLTLNSSSAILPAPTNQNAVLPPSTTGTAALPPPPAPKDVVAWDNSTAVARPIDGQDNLVTTDAGDLNSIVNGVPVAGAISALPNTTATAPAQQQPQQQPQQQQQQQQPQTQNQGQQAPVQNQGQQQTATPPAASEVPPPPAKEEQQDKETKKEKEKKEKQEKKKEKEAEKAKKAEEEKAKQDEETQQRESQVQANKTDVNPITVLVPAVVEAPAPAPMDSVDREINVEYEDYSIGGTIADTPAPAPKPKRPPPTTADDTTMDYTLEDLGPRPAPTTPRDDEDAVDYTLEDLGPRPAPTPPRDDEDAVDYTIEDLVPQPALGSRDPVLAPAPAPESSRDLEDDELAYSEDYTLADMGPDLAPAPAPNERSGDTIVPVRGEEQYTISDDSEDYNIDDMAPAEAPSTNEKKDSDRRDDEDKDTGDNTSNSGVTISLLIQPLKKNGVFDKSKVAALCSGLGALAGLDSDTCAVTAYKAVEDKAGRKLLQNSGITFNVTSFITSETPEEVAAKLQDAQDSGELSDMLQKLGFRLVDNGVDISTQEKASDAQDNGADEQTTTSRDVTVVEAAPVPPAPSSNENDNNDDDDDDDGVNVVAIVVPIVVGVVLLLIFIPLLWWCCKRRQEKKKAQFISSSEDPRAPPAPISRALDGSPKSDTGSPADSAAMILPPDRAAASTSGADRSYEPPEYTGGELYQNDPYGYPTRASIALVKRDGHGSGSRRGSTSTHVAVATARNVEGYTGHSRNTTAVSGILMRNMPSEKETPRSENPSSSRQANPFIVVDAFETDSNAGSDLGSVFGHKRTMSRGGSRGPSRVGSRAQSRQHSRNPSLETVNFTQ